MPRRRTADAMEKDAQAADLFRRGLTYRQIATQLGWKNQASAFEAVRRSARDAARDSLAGPEALTMLLDRLQDYRRLAWRVATARHYALSGGEVVTGPDGAPLLDDAPVLHALDRLLRCDAEEAKLRDLYPPAKVRVQVITEEDIDAELARLTTEIAEDDAAAADPGPA